MSIEENRKKTSDNPQEISTVTKLTEKNDGMNQYYTEIFLNNKCIGESDIFVSFDDDGDIENAYCKSLMICPEYRNKGYGTEFLRRVACYYDGLYICPDNKNAERLYKRIGYECVSPQEFKSELDTYVKMYFIQPFENESIGKFSHSEIFDTEEEYDEWFKYHKFDSPVNRLFITKTTFLKRTKKGIKKEISGYNAEISLAGIGLETGLNHLINELMKYGFDFHMSDFLNYEFDTEFYAMSCSGRRFFIEKREYNLYISYTNYIELQG